MLKRHTPATVMQNHLNFLQATHETSPLVDDIFAIRHVYNHMNGYSGRFSQDAVAQLRALPEVDYVEQDQIVRIQDAQRSAPWGLARVSHRNKLSCGTSTIYEYEPTGGEGVDVYVIDTGINIAHVEFEGRASWRKTVPENEDDEDGHGHGTHCAGTVASRKYGGAKAANIIAVKILDPTGHGSTSDVLEGVSFATRSAPTKAKAAEAEYAATGKTAHKGSVVNMSLDVGTSKALNQAVNAAVDAGLHIAVGAGNNNGDACNSSPAAAEKVFTVGASTIADARASFSNYGPYVDATGSGTSVASPHAAGMLAYLLSLYPSETFDPELEMTPRAGETQRAFALAYLVAHAALPRWAALKKALLTLASKGKLSGLPAETVNLLIFNNATTS
ncbi:peptidase S8/S53 domain-containing protein [Mycena vulgaris]|nr:peptidase S8/S53 domain-containing protein [Mycena vulgaris]